MVSSLSLSLSLSLHLFVLLAFLFLSFSHSLSLSIHTGEEFIPLTQESVGEREYGTAADLEQNDAPLYLLSRRRFTKSERKFQTKTELITEFGSFTINKRFDEMKSGTRTLIIHGTDINVKNDVRSDLMSSFFL